MWALDALEHVTHGVRRTHQVSQRFLAADFLTQDPIFPLDMQFFDCAIQQVP